VYRYFIDDRRSRFCVLGSQFVFTIGSLLRCSREPEHEPST
jgi:hypothetical protein